MGIYDNQSFRIFVIVDEAKLLVSQRQNIKAVLKKYATEMRKFGVGLILASQLINHFNDEILANIAAKICMNAENADQAKTNGKLFDIPEKVLTNLGKGHCFLKTMEGLTELQVVPSWERMVL
jgi:DNA helicase HerA-like ATPase